MASSIFCLTLRLPLLFFFLHWSNCTNGIGILFHQRKVVSKILSSDIFHDKRYVIPSFNFTSTIWIILLEATSIYWSPSFELTAEDVSFFDIKRVVQFGVGVSNIDDFGVSFEAVAGDLNFLPLDANYFIFILGEGTDLYSCSSVVIGRAVIGNRVFSASLKIFIQSAWAKNNFLICLSFFLFNKISFYP